MRSHRDTVLAPNHVIVEVYKKEVSAIREGHGLCLLRPEILSADCNGRHIHEY